jgi:hypothetical protein
MTIEWRLQKIYTPEEEEERARKALSIAFGEAMESETTKKNFVQLKAASKTKPTIIVDKLKAPFKRPTTPYKRFLPNQPPPLESKLKAASVAPRIDVPPSSQPRVQVYPQPIKAAPRPSSSPSPSLQIAAVIPTHNIPDNIMESLDPERTTLIAKTECLGCGDKATQILQFTPGSEMRPTANPKVLRGYCQACKGDLLARYSGSAL